MCYRHFEYQIMFFNLINILAIFQVYINYALYDLVDDFCIVYFDDILVFFKIKKEHYQHLKFIIKCLRHIEFYANLKKCDFFKIEIKYFNFFINKNSLCINFFHIKIISD